MPRLLLTIGLALLAAGATPASAAHPHYLGLLREGVYALERGSAEDAARTLRLACFGFLEEPLLLAPCLVQLGVAQAMSGDGPGFRESFQRLAEVEERFGAYSQAEIPAELRIRYEAAVRARIPHSMLEATPALGRLVADAGEPPAPGGPGAVEREADGSEPPPVQAAPPPPPLPPPRPAEAPAPASALTDDDLKALAQARGLLAGARTRGDLEEPFRLAREVADARPASRTAQYLAAEIAYRAARWEEAVAYFRRGGDPADGNPMLLFYMAVSLYEAGEPEAAADALRRSLPRIEHTPFVRAYRSKILGDGA